MFTKTSSKNYNILSSCDPRLFPASTHSQLQDFVEFLYQLSSLHGKNSILVIGAVFWVMWLERNRITFKTVFFFLFGLPGHMELEALFSVSDDERDQLHQL
jgi:hypothetical protein